MTQETSFTDPGAESAARAAQLAAMAVAVIEAAARWRAQRLTLPPVPGPRFAPPLTDPAQLPDRLSAPAPDAQPARAPSVIAGEAFPGRPTPRPQGSPGTAVAIRPAAFLITSVGERRQPPAARGGAGVAR